MCLLQARSSLTFTQTIECGFTLKLLYDMIIIYSQMHHTGKYSKHSSIIWPVWLNGWIFTYELCGCGFKSVLLIFKKIMIILALSPRTFLKKYTLWRECKVLFLSHFSYHQKLQFSWKFHWNSPSLSENMNIYFLNFNYFCQLFEFFYLYLLQKKLMTSASIK